MRGDGLSRPAGAAPSGRQVLAHLDTGDDKRRPDNAIDGRAGDHGAD